MWRNIKFLHMWINFTFLHMTDVETSEISFIISDLRCFVAKSLCREIVLSRFTRHCVEKSLAKNCARGEKMTNMRYVYNLWCFVAFYNNLLPNQFFLQFTLFCREISFGTICALLGGEKFGQKLCPWRKNDKYEVCIPHHYHCS